MFHIERGTRQCYVSVASWAVAAAPALRVADIPLLHRDPFDRMLIAQALCEPMRLVTADAMVATYAPVCGVLIEPVGGA